MSQETTELLLRITADTDKAILVDDEDGIICWLPKSQITIEDDDWELGQAINITIPEWLATEKGLV